MTRLPLGGFPHFRVSGFPGFLSNLVSFVTRFPPFPQFPGFLFSPISVLRVLRFPGSRVSPSPGFFRFPGFPGSPKFQVPQGSPDARDHHEGKALAHAAHRGGALTWGMGDRRVRLRRLPLDGMPMCIWTPCNASHHHYSCSVHSVCNGTRSRASPKPPHARSGAWELLQEVTPFPPISVPGGFPLFPHFGSSWFPPFPFQPGYPHLRVSFPTWFPPQPGFLFNMVSFSYGYPHLRVTGFPGFLFNLVTPI